MDEHDDTDPLGQLLEDLRQRGEPSRAWHDAHARDGRFHDAWVAASDPLDVWRVLRWAPTSDRYLRLAAVSAEMLVPVLERFPEVRSAAQVVAGWRDGDELVGEPLAAAKDVLVTHCEARTLGLDELCAASAFVSLVDMLLAHRAGVLTPERASTDALFIVEHTVDALGLERREAVYRALTDAGVERAQAERAAQVAFSCAGEARAAELAARLTAAIECPRLDELDGRPRGV